MLRLNRIFLQADNFTLRQSGLSLSSIYFVVPAIKAVQIIHELKSFFLNLTVNLIAFLTLWINLMVPLLNQFMQGIFSFKIQLPTSKPKVNIFKLTFIKSKANCTGKKLSPVLHT